MSLFLNRGRAKRNVPAILEGTSRARGFWTTRGDHGAKTFNLRLHCVWSSESVRTLSLKVPVDLRENCFHKLSELQRNGSAHSNDALCGGRDF